MSTQRNLVAVILKDRPLQIGILALFLFGIYLLQKPTEPSEPTDKRSSIADVPKHLLTDLGGVEPLIIELPASKDDATRAYVAQLSGRAVLVLDESGIWHRKEPARDEEGDPEDHSDTLAGVAKLLCLEDGAENRELGLPELSKEDLRRYCEIIPKEIGSE